jgi:hypothetical protein
VEDRHRRKMSRREQRLTVNNTVGSCRKNSRVAM